MPLAEQRNRFLSFAFASADILIETDTSGVISYVAGASATLGNEIEIGSTELGRRFDNTSRAIFRALLKGAKPGRRIGPARITIQNREAELSGWQLDRDASIRWTIAYEAATAPDDVDPEPFQRVAAEALDAARGAGVPMGMAVVRIEDAADLERVLGNGTADRVRIAIQTLCNDYAGSAGAVRPIGADRFALIHIASADLTALKKDIEAVLAENGLGDSTVLIDSIADEPDLDPEIAAKAFIHAVNAAADTNAALDIRSLREAANAMMEEAQAKVKELQTTISGRVVEPYAQPIIDLRTGDVHHYELLLRLPGGAPLGDSVMFAERTGMIGEIDFQMTEIAASFLRENIDYPALAVNLSGKSISNPNWVARFLRLLADLKIDRSRLSFELTETAGVAGLQVAQKTLEKIRERGHKVCLDDFGVGTASFQYLRDFPVDAVKIDGSFVKGAVKREREAHILKGIVELCQGLGAETITEMVENDVTAKHVKSLGVTYAQGYYFGKPVPLKTLKSLQGKSTRAA